MNHTENIIVGIVLLLALMLLGMLNRRKAPELENKAPDARITPTRQTPMMAAYHDAIHASGKDARPEARPRDHL